MDQQLRFTAPELYHHSGAWCRVTQGAPKWDGLDFEPCFRIRLFDGYIPIAFLAISTSFFVFRLIVALASHISRRRIALYQPVPTSDRALSSKTSEGSRPIALAEARVLQHVAKSESPDWSDPLTQRELLGSSEAVKLAEASAALESNLGTPLAVPRAIWGCKKDLLAVASSAAITGLCAWKVVLAYRRHVDGRAWVVFELAAWAWALILALVKLSFGIRHRLFAIRHPDAPHRATSPFYTTLERHLIPFYVVYSGATAFVGLRSAVLDHSASPSRLTDEHLRVEAALFAVTTALFLLDFFSARPSRYSSRSKRAQKANKTSPRPPPPEMNASLFSLATFSHMDGFLLKSAFPRAFKGETISANNVPDLRPDDKTARVLLSYRQSLRRLDSRLARLPRFIRRIALRDEDGVEELGLTWKLIYHFWPMLVVQISWAILPVLVNGVPPVMLNQILSAIAARSRGEHIPNHVLLLYAWITFVATIVVSIGRSLSLFLGRRICIRLRSIIVGEVFTKALRRKDQAGHSSIDKATVEADSEGSVPQSAEIPTVKVSDENGESQVASKELSQLEEELDKASSGKIMNLISSDTYQLSEVCAYLHFVCSEMPGTMIVSIYLLYRLLGISAFVAIAILLLLIPVQGQVSSLFNRYQLRLLAAADQRLALATEVIGQIRIVKFFAWEKSFLKRMDATRQKELSALWKRALTIVASTFMAFGAPIFVSVSVFVFHTKVLKKDLTAETAFTALVLLQILRAPLETIGDMLVHILQANVSLRRIDEYLHEQETQKYAVLAEAPATSKTKVGFVDATFTWGDEAQAREDSSVFRLRDLDLDFPDGQLSIVLGPVGSGKSTLLLSLLGETNRLSGSAYLPSPVIRSTDLDPSLLTDTTAYAAQTPWLQSATIRENIVFGAMFNQRRYEAVLEACALNPDLAQFELGDETEVGEKGTVLSGGQKARISLARAIYSSAKVVLLDDVLSAVDSHTAQHLVERCLRGKLMRHRTCILVTHAVDLCLPSAGFVVSLDQGTVVTAGKPDGADFRATLEATRHDQPLVSESSITIEELADGAPDEEQAAERKRRMEQLKLVKEESRSEGSVKREVYATYIRAFGGWGVLVAVLTVYGAAQLADIAVTLTLRYWAGSFEERQTSTLSFLALGGPAMRLHSAVRHIVPSVPNVTILSASPVASGTVAAEQGRSPDYWLGMYCLAALVNIILANARAAFFFWRGLKASSTLYSQLITRILGARTRFFDSTPSGRILNRLSRDVQVIDQDLPTSGMFWTYEVLAALAIVVVISLNLPAFLIFSVVITLAYSFLGQLYVTSSRELKRLESVSKSPIFSVFGEALQGVATIRAYGDASRFMTQIFGLLDTNNRPFFNLWLANRWLSLRVDAFGGLVALIAVVFITYTPSIDAALAGFILSFAVSFQDRLLWVVRLSADLEVQANSVERIQEYLDIDQESQGGIKPPAIWPTRGGSISVKKLTASYAPELDPVLKGVSFEVMGGEKVGIVGRTGSGKSSLALSFFRFIEPSSGNITIDGLNINTLRLEDLRSRLTIVAQEAALFAGTLRFNLDPFDEHDDRDVWDALRRVQMAAPGASGITPKPTPRPTPGPSRAASIKDDDSDTIAAEEADRFVVKSLDMQVKEGGKNFSAGQRQLLALARGILKLKSSSILILDESTASLDSATDERIQQTIRDEMADATILCIAHRLRTIIDYDKVLVLDHGVVLEYDSPSNLLAQEDSSFAGLCRKSGEYDVLKKMAEEAEQARR
ncbi:hypothetical protein JCM10908_001069 [Rhodotorula pacifica]|uniref:uncharacterized protein n=1 Tax=Rhodotorula pacifica TaxID=1495444 RepID=UPI003175CFD3